jgi:Mg-chelatase subunit ChlD
MGTFLLVVTPPASPPPDIAFADTTALRCTNCGGTLLDPSRIKPLPGIGPGWCCEFCGVVVATTRKEARIGLPRDVVFLVDRSCSMRGQAIPLARLAVRVILSHLGKDDAFQLFAFDHERTAVDGNGEEFLPVNKETRHRVDALFADLQARGGTELDEALERACKIPKREGRTRLVVLITDAAVGNEGRLLRKLPELLGDTRLYVLGLGPSVHRYLVERLARVGGGASDVVAAAEDLDTVATRFAKRVRMGGPVLTGLRLVWDDAMPVDVYPNPIADLFGGQTVQLLGRFGGVGKTRLALLGQTALGAPFRQEIDVDLPESSSEVPGLERLWAKLRIDARLDALAQAPEQAAEVRMEVLGLALRHSLVTPYTALVAEDSEQRVEGETRRIEVPMRAPSEAMAPPAEDARMSSGEHVKVKAKRMTTSAGMVPQALEETLDDKPGFIAAAPMGAMEFDALPAIPTSSPRSMERHFDSDAPPLAKGGGGLGLIDGVVALFGRGSSSKHAVAPAVARRIALAPPLPASPPPASSPPMQAQGKRQSSSGSLASEPYTRDMLAYVASKGVGELDLVFLVDETGSMGAYIAEVKRRLLELIDALHAAPLCRSLRLGLVSYRDHPPEDHSFVSRVVPLTDNLKAIRKGVERMEAQGGGDGPESVTDGLYDVVRLEWRPRAARVVVWVGDAPPHGVEPRGDGFPKGCPCGHHWYAQAENCREMGIVIHAVGCLPALTGFVGAEEVFRTVAKTTRGLYLPLSQAPVLIPLISGVAETELDKQRIEERIAEVLAAHEEELRRADEQERVRFVTDVLQDQGVRPRSMDYDGKREAATLRFRDLVAEDVSEGLDRLRRLGRTSV